MSVPNYLNPTLAPGERAKDLLGRMSLEEKMAQLICYNPANWSNDDLDRDFPLGAGEVAFLYATELASKEEVAEKLRALQDVMMEKSPHRIPAIFHMETLCGAMMPGAAGFGAGINQGATWDPALQKRMADLIRRQTRSIGVRHAFAPVLDISRDSRFGRQGETYGEDPALASAMGAAYVQGMQNEGDLKEGVLCAAKHFLGYHHTEGGIHAAACDVPPRQLREVYGKPFQAAMAEADLASVMNCYSVIDGEPVAGNKALLTDLLRNEMGFTGLVVADYVSISEMVNRQRVCETKAQAGKRALEAGMDVELPSKDCYNDELTEMVRRGEVDEALVDRSALRVLESKFRLGLFENPYPSSEEEIRAAFSDPEARALALNSALESLILMKNDGTLPIRPGVKKIVMVGHHAKSVRALFGGYSFVSMTESALGVGNTMAGVDIGETPKADEKCTYPGSYVQMENPLTNAVAQKNYPEAVSVFEGLQKLMPEADIRCVYGYPYAGDDESHHDEALRAIADADLVILTLGGKYGWGTASTTGEGIDATSINLPVCQERFIEKAAKLGRPMVGVHFDGRPISSDAADHYLNAILEAFSPGGAGGEAIARALTGQYNPAGRLPVTVAYNAGQIPVYHSHLNGSGWHVGTCSAFTTYVDAPHAPRYPFGHGLSYTTFEYRDMAVSEKEPDPEGSVSVSVEIRNAGTVEGEEVVQLYVRDPICSMARPVKELAGFLRVRLMPGEAKRVCFTMKLSQFAFLDREMNWRVESGELEFLAGASSEDIRLTEAVRVAREAVVDGKTRGFYAQAEIL